MRAELLLTLRFGTDGVRGVANQDITPDLTLALGRVAARLLGPGPFVIGRDTRRSGPMLEAALAAGIAAEGDDVELAGVVPTPAVAWACATRDLPGAMISASHNPFGDNGIKLFARGGRKLSDDVEAQLEAELDDVWQRHDLPAMPPVGEAVGVISRSSAVRDGYAANVAASLEGRRLDGLRIVIDCANGSASTVARDVLTGLGAVVTAIHEHPDGVNINAACGSTHPDDLQAAVVEAGAAVGLAFDGDADRVVAVDQTGAVVDGDQVIALCAADLRARGRLRGDTVVVTVMSNLGFRQAMGRAGIHVVDTQVGDRYVMEALEAGDFSLGGEQSGHVIFRDLATTGDGLLTGLQLLDLLVRAEQPLATLAGASMTALPQVLVNVRLAHRPADLLERLVPAVTEAENSLAGGGRVLLRPSGTEPVIRVMVEAPTETEAHEVATLLAAAVEAAAT